MFHADRLHRSPVELERFIALAQAKSLEIRTVQSGAIDLTTSAGRMVARVLGSVARQESEHASERRKRANLQKAQAGEWVSSRRTFGYTQSGEPFEPEASAVASAVRDVLAGKPIRQVVREWNDLGLRSTSGNAWNSTTVRRVLLNPKYAALRVHQGKIIGPGRWEALVTEDEHRGIVAVLNDPERWRYAKGFARKFQGTGVYLCGVCGESVVLHRPTRGGRAYKCPQNHVRRQGEALDEYISDLVIERLSRPDAIELLNDRPDVHTLHARRDVVQARLNELARQFAAGTIDGAQLASGSAELRKSADSIDAQIVAARIADPLADLVLAGAQIREVWGQAPADVRGRVIDSLMRVVILRSPKGLRRFDPSTIQIDWKQHGAD